MKQDWKENEVGLFDKLVECTNNGLPLKVTILPKKACSKRIKTSAGYISENQWNEWCQTIFKESKDAPVPDHIEKVNEEYHVMDENNNLIAILSKGVWQRIQKTHKRNRDESKSNVRESGS